MKPGANDDGWQSDRIAQAKHGVTVEIASGGRRMKERRNILKTCQNEMPVRNRLWLLRLLPLSAHARRPRRAFHI